MLRIKNNPYVGRLVFSWKHVCARNDVTSGRELAMDHRLNGIISIEHSGSIQTGRDSLIIKA